MIYTTHDIDRLFKWNSIKSLIGEHYRKLSSSSTWQFDEIWRSYFNRSKRDPFNNLKMIHKINTSMGFKSVFYIMTTQDKHVKNINDYTLDDIQSTLIHLLDNDAEIGIHFSYNTYNDLELMLKEKKALEKCIGKKIKRSRQHYLRFEYPGTFELLRRCGIENDSSILIQPNDNDHKHLSTYEMKDENGNSLGINQTPLIFMETHHINKPKKEFLMIFQNSVEKFKNKNSEAMVLWHNNNISNNYEIELYKDALNILKSN